MPILFWYYTRCYNNHRYTTIILSRSIFHAHVDYYTYSHIDMYLFCFHCYLHIDRHHHHRYLLNILLLYIVPKYMLPTSPITK